MYANRKTKTSLLAANSVLWRLLPAAVFIWSFFTPVSAPITWFEKLSREGLHPYAPETLPVGTLSLILLAAFLIALVFVLGAQTLRGRLYTRETLRSFVELLLAATAALIFALAIVEPLKHVVHKYRPNALSACYHYHGIDDLQEVLKLEKFSRTSPEVTVKQIDCIAARIHLHANVADLVKSFPSGHTALAFAVLGAIADWFSREFSTACKSCAGWSTVLYGCGGFLLACYIAGTRLRDARHDVVDVLFGALIGLCCTRLSVMLAKQETQALFEPPAQSDDSDLLHKSVI